MRHRIATANEDAAQLKATEIRGKEIPNVIDELPILAVAGALAHGTMVIADAKELRVKETDRLAAIATNLRAMGAEVEERDDGLKIAGQQKLHGAEIDSFGDHRIAMAFAVAALRAEGETTIRRADAAAISYPAFFDTLDILLAR